MNHDHPDTHQKALAINIDATRFGTFAEIGAGQEVARWFFLVGGAAGTVAKTISAYDMAVSDAVYGPVKRYVSRERLQAMLETGGRDGARPSILVAAPCRLELKSSGGGFPRALLKPRVRPCSKDALFFIKRLISWDVDRSARMIANPSTRTNGDKRTCISA